VTAGRQWVGSAMAVAYRRWLSGQIGGDAPAPPTAPAARMLGLALAGMADPEGLLHPGVAYLARLTGLSTRSVQRHLRALADSGWLDVESHGHRGSRAAYRLRIPAWAVKGDSGVTLSGSAHTGKGDSGVAKG